MQCGARDSVTPRRCSPRLSSGRHPVGIHRKVEPSAPADHPNALNKRANTRKRWRAPETKKPLHLEPPL